MILLLSILAVTIALIAIEKLIKVKLPYKGVMFKKTS